MDLRGLAHLGCRLLAVYLAIEALAGLAGWGAILFATAPVAAQWPAELGAAFVLLVAAGGLWFYALPLSQRLADRAGRPRQSGVEGPVRATILATGVLVIAGAIGDFAALVPWIRNWLNGGPARELLGAPGVYAGALRLSVGIGLLLAADRLARRLKTGSAGLAELVGQFVGAAGTEGARQVAELALTLKSGAEEVARRVVKSSLDALIAVVEQRRPDFSSATAPDGTVTIVFSDMEGFTAMTQRLGDRRAHEVIKIHNRIVREAVKAHRGKEVELQGDGFLLAFPRTAAALRCAGAIQRECRRHSREHVDTPIRVRIGLHCGKPIKEGDRFFGITVILAARIAAQASGGETLVSAGVYEELAQGGEFGFDRGRTAQLKGLEGMHRMYGVLDYGEPIGTLRE